MGCGSVIILDTCALIFDALTPQKLTLSAKKAITTAEKQQQLYCSDISLWETAMLVQKKRLTVDVEIQEFLHLIINARGVKVLPINVEIAAIATTYAGYNHYDPADRIIAATTLYHQAALVTSDKELSSIKDLPVIW